MTCDCLSLIRDIERSSCHHRDLEIRIARCLGYQAKRFERAGYRVKRPGESHWQALPRWLWDLEDANRLRPKSLQIEMTLLGNGACEVTGVDWVQPDGLFFVDHQGVETDPATALTTAILAAIHERDHGP